MKINENEKKVLVDGDNFEVLESSINQDKFKKMFWIFSNLYRNVFGTIIREYTSNIYDACIEAGVKEAGIIEFAEDDKGTYVSFIDKGIGISPERYKNVFIKFLESTKEGSNDVIGYYGLGSKSALAYTDHFFINTVYDGIYYSYMMRKGENGIPKHELLLSHKTDKSNGTEIRIHLLDDDIYDFKKELTKQLAYFDNIYVKDPYSSTYFNNEYKIYEGKHFKFKNIDFPYHNIHICLGKVAYQINWNELGIGPLEIPIALKFDIGDINVTPSREDIEYSPSSVKLIKEKIKLAIEELGEIFEKKEKYYNDILSYVRKTNYHNYSINITFGENDVLSIGLEDNILSYYDFRYVYVPLSELPSKIVERIVRYNYFFKEYYVSSRINFSGRKTSNPGDYNITSIFQKNEGRLYRANEDLKTKKNKYLASLSNNNYTYIIKKHRRVTLEQYKNWLNLSTVHKSKWRKYITLFQKVVYSEFLKNTKSYDDVKIDKNWLDLTTKPRVKREKNTISISEIIKRDYYSSKYNKINKKVSEIERNREVVIYTNNDNREKLKTLHNTLKNYLNFSHIHFYIVADRNQKYFNFRNHFSYEEFMKGDSKIIRDLYTALKISWLVDKYKHIYPLFKDVNDDIYNKFSNISDFRKKYLDSRYISMDKLESFIDSIVNEHRNGKPIEFLNIKIYSEYGEILKYLKDCELISFISPNVAEEDDNFFMYLADFLKLKKKRLNKEFYMKPFKGEENFIEDIEKTKEEKKELIKGCRTTSARRKLEASINC